MFFNKLIVYIIKAQKIAYPKHLSFKIFKILDTYWIHIDPFPSHIWQWMTVEKFASQSIYLYGLISSFRMNVLPDFYLFIGALFALSPSSLPFSPSSLFILLYLPRGGGIQGVVVVTPKVGAGSQTISLIISTAITISADY